MRYVNIQLKSSLHASKFLQDKDVPQSYTKPPLVFFLPIYNCSKELKLTARGNVSFFFSTITSSGEAGNKGAAELHQHSLCPQGTTVIDSAPTLKPKH